MTIDRRQFLTGAGVALSLPFLESLKRSAHAQTSPMFPRRLVIFYATQGHPYPAIRDPMGTPNDYRLNDVFQQPVNRNTGQVTGSIMDPDAICLANFKDQMSIITGMSVASANAQPGNAHNLACGHSLVGQAMLAGGPNQDHTLSGGASIDDLIASRITPRTVAFKALHTSIARPREICFSGPASPVSRLVDPDEVATWLFGDFQNPNAVDVQRRRARRKSVLDATRANIASLRRRLSGSDGERLDAYLERIRGVEQRISGYVAGESCRPIGGFGLQRSPNRDGEGPNEFHPYYDRDLAFPALVDAMVEGLACDRTRVATVTCAHGTSYPWMRYRDGQLPAPGYTGPAYPNAGVSGNWHHDIVHAYWPDSDPNSEAAYEQAVIGDFMRRAARWEMSQFAYLLHRLSSKREGDKTMLDNTVVLYVNEFGSRTHGHDGMMYIVAGGGGGKLRTGQWLQLDGEPHNRLFLSLLRAFDINDVDTFGDPRWCTDGPITQLLA